MPDTLTRDQIGARRDMDVHIRAKADGRGFTGIGVPYGEEIELWGLRERFEPGCVELDMDGVPSLVLWRHDEPIGKITAGRDTETGFEIEASLSATERGREAAMLLDDGVITRLSIGFVPIEWRIEHDEDADTDVIVHTKVRALEFSLVPFPAYAGATVQSVRHRPTPPEQSERTSAMPETLTRDDMTAALTPLTEGLDDLERQLNLLAAGGSSAPNPGRNWRSMGEFLKALASGDESAAEFHRAFTGATTADDLTKDNFVGNFIKFVDERRKLINTFARDTLPAQGMTVDFVRLEGDTLKAGKQTKEGADLPGPGKVNLKADNEAIDTFGGWTELSRQLIERSTVNYLNLVLKALGIKYAKATEEAFRAKLTEVMTARDSDALTLPAKADYTDWLTSIVDAGQAYEESGMELQGLLMSPDWFKELMTVEAADGRPIMSVYGQGTNVIGQVDLPKGEGNLTSVPVKVLWGETGKATFFDSAALQTMESPGAPAQLQDENIVNLTKQFSIYGYAAFIDPFPQGIVPVKKTSAGVP
ncbi:phage major capsid protein [Brevibacterium otitidis]|uniref:Phage major capsid protein n=1 Tax=Brevibacterium otitidis TaxID=53364 RepID=A0ABV5X0B2_9MICO|nr:HK97 family phage prohead protease [Brevibacterium otitidis]